MVLESLGEYEHSHLTWCDAHLLSGKKISVRTEAGSDIIVIIVIT
mgnify:FL=1